VGIYQWFGPICTEHAQRLLFNEVPENVVTEMSSATKVVLVYVGQHREASCCQWENFRR